MFTVRFTERQPAWSKLQSLTMFFAIINTSGGPHTIQARTIAMNPANLSQLLSHSISADAAINH